MTFPNDDQFEETTVAKVHPAENGWTIERADGFSFFVPNNGVEPKAGMTARFYGRGIGSVVRGLFLDGQKVFYKTPDEQKAEDDAWRADYQERQRKIALEPTTPEQQIPGFEWTEDMREISGFHGGYERTCRAMVSAGCKWLTDHPTADPEFRGFKNIYGVITEENADAERLTKVITDAAGGDCTGAMHQASIGHIMRWKHHHKGSWAGYQDEMRRLKLEERAA